MLLIHCPYCEEDRPELEFRHAGQAHIARPAPIADIPDEAFEDYFFIRGNPKGPYFERWRHIHGCARFFNAARNTVTDQFVATYKAGERKPALAAAPAPAKKAARAAPARKTSNATRRPAKAKSASRAKSPGAKKR